MTTESDPHGFFWRTDDAFYCIVHHKARKVPTGKGRGKTSFCKQYSAPTPEALVKACREETEEIGYEIGTPKKVRELCESAPRWRFQTRKRGLRRPSARRAETENK